MQFAEDLSDRAAAHVVRSRIDWKYALSLDLTDPGCHYSVLAKFRKRLVAGQRPGRVMSEKPEGCADTGITTLLVSTLYPIPR